MKLIRSKELRKKEKERKQTYHTHILSLKLNLQKPHKGLSAKRVTSGLERNVSSKPSQLQCLLATNWPALSLMLWLYLMEVTSTFLQSVVLVYRGEQGAAPPQPFPPYLHILHLLYFPSKYFLPWDMGRVSDQHCYVNPPLTLRTNSTPTQAEEVGRTI